MERIVLYTIFDKMYYIFDTAARARSSRSSAAVFSLIPAGCGEKTHFLQTNLILLNYNRRSE
jgi:hypothetical protein